MSIFDKLKKGAAEASKTAAQSFVNKSETFTFAALPESLAEMKALGFEELCPKGCTVTPTLVEEWHARGFRVRAWGVTDRELMRSLYDAGVDGMTVNFPDALTEYVKGM